MKRFGSCRWSVMLFGSLVCVCCLCNYVYLFAQTSTSQYWNRICKTSGPFRVLLTSFAFKFVDRLKSGSSEELAKVQTRASWLENLAACCVSMTFDDHTAGPCKTMAIRSAQVVLRVDAELLIHQKVWTLMDPEISEMLRISLNQNLTRDDKGWQRSLSLSTGEAELLGRAKFANVQSGSEKGSETSHSMKEWKQFHRISWELIGDT